MSTVPRQVRRRRRVAASVALAVAAAGATSIVSDTGHAGVAGPETVQILSFNDYHGHVEAGTAGSIDGSFGGPAAGGGEFLSAKLTELRDASTADNQYTVAAGDLIGGSPFFSGLFHDEPSVETLNEMGLDFSGVGNHEFDEGVMELIRMQTGGCHPVDGCFFTDYDPDTLGDQEFGGADFQWLAANVTEDAPDGVDDFEDSIPDYTIETTSGGKKIAFIGMTLEATDTLVAASGIVGFTFEDEIEAAEDAVTAIKTEDPTVEAIVLMLHEGGIPDPFAINGCVGVSGPVVDIALGLDPEIDAVITGHTHQPYTCEFDDPDGNPRPVVSAWEFGKVVTEMNLELLPNGEVDRDSITTVNHEVLQSELTADPAITAILDKWAPLAEAIGNEEVGTITETITRGGDPSGSDRGVESAAGNLVADAQLAATSGLGADIALMNPGGLRSDLEFPESDAGEGDGVVTFGEAFTFQPFNNTMFVLPMTGAQITSVLEEQCQPGGSSRPVLHLGVSDGFTYDLAITTQAGVCTGVEVSNIELDGLPISMTETYQVAVNNFLADGGDNFDTFAEVDPVDRIPGPQDIDALIDYFDANSPVAPPPTDRVNETPTVLPSPIDGVTPARLLETRTGPDDKTVDGLFEGIGKVAPGGTVELTVADRGGVPSDADAVVLNIGAIQPSAAGFLTVWPCTDPRPLASNVNFLAFDIVSNAVLAQLSDDGTVCIYSSAETDLIADVNSVVPDDGSPRPVTPSRLLETRNGPDDKTVDGLFEGSGPLAGGSEIELLVAGRDGVPFTAEAVMLNVGAVLPADNGFFTVYPCGEDRPLASSVNYFAGDLVSNGVLAKLGVAGTVCIYTSATTDVIADVNAFVPAGGSPTALTPARLLETRTGPDDETVDGLFEGAGRVAADTTVELQVTGRGGVPDDADTVVLNLGSVLAGDAGFLTVHPCDEKRPLASNVNYLGADIVSNSVIAKVGGDGKVCIYTKAETDLIADVTATSSPPVPHRE
ncbi:MAG: bifunctional metallophosphatase/5'-nucleotidase [Ilumatobacter sp.]|nr:bifunctional metallophosphatase/5'-nucleotidase [Ilumatobacter sp.]